MRRSSRRQGAPVPLCCCPALSHGGWSCAVVAEPAPGGRRRSGDRGRPSEGPGGSAGARVTAAASVRDRKPRRVRLGRLRRLLRESGGLRAGLAWTLGHHDGAGESPLHASAPTVANSFDEDPRLRCRGIVGVGIAKLARLIRNPRPVRLTTQRIPVTREVHRNGPTFVERPYRSVKAFSGPLPTHRIPIQVVI